MPTFYHSVVQESICEIGETRNSIYTDSSKTTRSAREKMKIKKSKQIQSAHIKTKQEKQNKPIRPTKKQNLKKLHKSHECYKNARACHQNRAKIDARKEIFCNSVLEMIKTQFLTQNEKPDKESVKP